MVSTAYLLPNPIPPLKSVNSVNDMNVVNGVNGVNERTKLVQTFTGVHGAFTERSRQEKKYQFISMYYKNRSRCSRCSWGLEAFSDTRDRGWGGRRKNVPWRQRHARH